MGLDTEADYGNRELNAAAQVQVDAWTREWTGYVAPGLGRDHEEEFCAPDGDFGGSVDGIEPIDELSAWGMRVVDYSKGVRSNNSLGLVAGPDDSAYWENGGAAVLNGMILNGLLVEGEEFVGEGMDVEPDELVDGTVEEISRALASPERITWKSKGRASNEGLKSAGKPKIRRGESVRRSIGGARRLKEETRRLALRQL